MTESRRSFRGSPACAPLSVLSCLHLHSVVCFFITFSVRNCCSAVLFMKLQLCRPQELDFRSALASFWAIPHAAFLSPNFQKRQAVPSDCAVAGSFIHISRCWRCTIVYACVFSCWAAKGCQPKQFRICCLRFDVQLAARPPYQHPFVISALPTGCVLFCVFGSYAGA